MSAVATALRQQAKTKRITSALIGKVNGKRDEIVRLLETIQSHQSIEDEFFKTIDCLENIGIEEEYLNAGSVGSIASIPPVNLPMYSLIIFGVIPSLMTERLYMRPPTRMTEVYLELYKLLDIESICPHIVLATGIERQDFTDRYTQYADVVLFTGTHTNATKIMKSIRKDALFLYNGAGINPIVVFDNGDIESAVKNALFTKSFNSGQDCAGPDAILVEDTVIDEFMERLCDGVKKLTIGSSYDDSSVVIGPLLEQTQLKDLTKLLSQNQKYITEGGLIDFKNNTVYPTVINKPVTEGANYDELFAPIFFVQSFTKSSFKDYFDTVRYTNFAMYVTYFGSDFELEATVRDSVPVRDTNVIEVERGNKAYGGYGYYASYAQCHKNKIPKPILISKEIASFIDRTVE